MLIHYVVMIDNQALTNIHIYNSGVKKSLVLEPGTSKISIRTSKNFHPMSDGQVKKIQ